MKLRRLAKMAVVRSGALGLYHRLTHREQLTVLMFHRVLPSELMENADPEYTISTELLASLMALAATHYRFVGLGDVLASLHKQRPLPPSPALVTFDDGWDDNARFAAPVLAAAGIPWTLFAATDAICSGETWWQENLLAGLRMGRASHADLHAAVTGVTPPLSDADPNLSILMLCGSLPPDKREAFMKRHVGGSSMRTGYRHMASWDTLRTLQAAGVGIGGHGASHLPLTMLADPVSDLREAQSLMRRELGDSACTSMSFPHGRYSPAIVREARELGMQLLFTSDPVLNPCKEGWLASDIIGRIPISTAQISSGKGGLDPERALPWLMVR